MPTSLRMFKAELFKALAHPTRIQILELLRSGEKSVGEIQSEIGSEGSAVSQQLAILRLRNLVEARKSGNLNYYRIRDLQVNQLLDVARAMFDAHLTQLQTINDSVET